MKDPSTIANLYYDAWINRAGDMTGVPLAEDFSFRRPVASFYDAAGYRRMAAQAGAAVRSFRVRRPGAVRRIRPAVDDSVLGGAETELVVQPA